MYQPSPSSFPPLRLKGNWALEAGQVGPNICLLEDPVQHLLAHLLSTVGFQMCPQMSCHVWPSCCLVGPIEHFSHPRTSPTPSDAKIWSPALPSSQSHSNTPPHSHPGAFSCSSPSFPSSSPFLRILPPFPSTSAESTCPSCDHTLWSQVSIYRCLTWLAGRSPHQILGLFYPHLSSFFSFFLVSSHFSNLSCR